MEKNKPTLSKQSQSQLKNIKGASHHIHRLGYEDPSKNPEEHKERVEYLMEHISALLSMAHDSIADKSIEPSIEDLIEIVQDKVIEAAAGAKEDGQRDISSSMIEPLLALNALFRGHDNPHQLALKIVSSGLAPEAIIATSNTRGVIANDSIDSWDMSYGFHSFTPLSKLVADDYRLFKVAIGEDGESIDEIEERILRDEDLLSELHIDELLAIHKQCEKNMDKGRSRQILLRCINLISDQIKRYDQGEDRSLLVDTGSISIIITESVKLGLDSQVAILTEQVRRCLLSKDEPKLDSLIGKLFSNVDTETLDSLLTPGKHNLDDLGPEIGERITQKTLALRRELVARGMPDEDKYFEEILKAKDPMSARYIPKDFEWKNEDGKFSEHFVRLVAGDRRSGMDYTDRLGTMSIIICSHLQYFQDSFNKLARKLDMDPESEVIYFTELIQLISNIPINSISMLDMQQFLNKDSPILILRAMQKCHLKKDSPLYVTDYFSDILGDSEAPDIPYELIDRVYIEYGNELPFEVVKQIINYRETAEGIISSISSLNLRQDQSDDLLTEISKSPDINSFSDLLITLKSNTNFSNDQLMGMLRMYPMSNRFATVKDLIKIQEKLLAIGSSLNSIEINYTILERLKDYIDVEGSEIDLNLIIASQQAGNTIKAILTPFKDKDWGEVGSGHKKKVELEDLSRIKDIFIKLQIPTDVAEKFFGSWKSFRPVKTFFYNKNNKVINDYNIDLITELFVDNLISEIKALIELHELVGLKNVLRITEVFGITHFRSHDPKMLKSQLERWDDGNIPTTNIAMIARADWNGASRDFGREAHKSLNDADSDTNGLFFFEINHPNDIDRVMKSVGDRERRNSRVPEENNLVKNVVIWGHGSPKGIRIGINGESITVDAIINALSFIKSSEGNRLNASKRNYSRDIGSNYTIILNSCSTAGEVEIGENYAKSLSDYLGMNVEVHGADETIYGAFIIKDGRVFFNKGQLPASTYHSGE